MPRWRKGSGEGWVTAEYAMLPRSTNTRTDRESVRGRIGGRTHEISRLVGRSPARRASTRRALGENTIVLDCDVLQADGGTRTAAITGAYVALVDAVEWARGQGLIKPGAEPLMESVAAVSVGVVDGAPVLDLDYVEDVAADTDMNVVVTGDGRFVEVQGTAEGAPFDRAELDRLLDLAARRVRGAGQAAAGGPRPVTGPRRLVLATRNAHKVAELRRILAEPAAGVDGVEVVGLDAFPGRPGRRRDRRHLRGERPAQGARGGGGDRLLPSVADDSGLCVDVLGGSPGVFSARWAGRHGDDRANLDLLLAQLATCRTCTAAPGSLCAAALALPDGSEHVAHGRLDGTARAGAARQRADSATTRSSFRTATAGRWPSTPLPRRTPISHRGRAFRALAAGASWTL